VRDERTYSFEILGDIGRSGVIERSIVSAESGSRDRFRYYLDDNRLLLPFNRVLTPEMADLLDVCLAIAMCDRRAPRVLGRRKAHVALGSVRIINVSIPVRCLELWNRAEVVEAVILLAQLLTGDIWNIRFEHRERPSRQVAHQESFTPRLSIRQAIVALHSGGLDSLLGMAKVLAANEQVTLIPVSLITNSKTIRVVEKVTKSLQGTIPEASIRGSYVRLVHRRNGRPIDDRERECRTRILPCLAAGIAVATEFADGRLQLTENGPGAVNLPTSLEQLDTWTTRATHPMTLESFAHLATVVLECEIRIDNTGWLQTKGELAIAQLHDQRFHNAARLTVSCERFPYSNADSPCGACMSCLYRKMALHAASLGNIDGERKSHSWERDKYAEVPLGQAALAVFVEQLKRFLFSEDPHDKLSAQYRRIDEVLEVARYLGMTEDAVRNSIVDLYRTFIAEAEAFFSADLTMFPQQRDRAVAS
jgi:7-cyano-7-deazaguanine synthase in queuosine biosynthesis